MLFTNYLTLLLTLSIFSFFIFLHFLMLSIKGSTIDTKIMSTKEHLCLTFFFTSNDFNTFLISTTNLMLLTIAIIFLTKLFENTISYITFLIYLLSTLSYNFLKSISITVLLSFLFFLHTISVFITLI